MKKIIGSIAGVFILLLIAGGSTLSAASTSVNEMNKMNEQDPVMPAKELYDAYKKDEEAAGELYRMKIEKVTGYVVFVGPDVYGLPSVELSERKGGKSRLLCVLPFTDYLKLRKVSKGDKVIISGGVRGYYEKGDPVLLKKCEIVGE